MRGGEGEREVKWSCFAQQTIHKSCKRTFNTHDQYNINHIIIHLMEQLFTEILLYTKATNKRV